MENNHNFDVNQVFGLDVNQLFDIDFNLPFDLDLDVNQPFDLDVDQNFKVDNNQMFNFADNQVNDLNHNQPVEQAPEPAQQPVPEYGQEIANPQQPAYVPEPTYDQELAPAQQPVYVEQPVYGQELAPAPQPVYGPDPVDPPQPAQVPEEPAPQQHNGPITKPAEMPEKNKVGRKAKPDNEGTPRQVQNRKAQQRHRDKRVVEVEDLRAEKAQMVARMQQMQAHIAHLQSTPIGQLQQEVINLRTHNVWLVGENTRLHNCVQELQNSVNGYVQMTENLQRTVKEKNQAIAPMTHWDSGFEDTLNGL